MLAYNCSPSFNWKKNLDDATIAKFQRELGAMGYKFQFITLAGFHALNYGMFDLAYRYARENMTAFVELQQKEFAAAERGFTAVKHQREVGTGYFDDVTQVLQAGKSSTTALHGRRGRTFSTRAAVRRNRQPQLTENAMKRDASKSRSQVRRTSRTCRPRDHAPGDRVVAHCTQYEQRPAP